MPNLLLDLEVDRVDLVDEGANSAAFIKLYKRKETSTTMEFNEILEQMKPEHAEAVKAELAKAKAAIPTPEEKAAADAKAAEEKAKMDDMTSELAKAKEKIVELESASVSKSKEQNMEDIIKGLDPAVQEVFKSIKAQKEAAEEIAKQAQAQKEKDEAIAKAKDLKSLPVAEDKLVEVMKGITPEVYEVLKAANKAIEDGGIFTEIGKSASNENGGDAWTKIEKKAEEIAKRDSVTKQKAIGTAISENPGLYKEYLDGGAN